MNTKISQLSVPAKRKRGTRAPRHLTAASRRFYEQIVDDFVMEPHHLRLLQLLCEAFDRGQEARKILDQEGLVVEHQKMGKRPHPAISVERDCRTQVARLTRELNLSEGPPDSLRPPSLQYGAKR
jgi:P27 family predicted phage terminase small subunit